MKSVATLASGLSQERLERSFTREGGSFRIATSIRSPSRPRPAASHSCRRAATATGRCPPPSATSRA